MHWPGTPASQPPAGSHASTSWSSIPQYPPVLEVFTHFWVEPFWLAAGQGRVWEEPQPMKTTSSEMDYTGRVTP